MSRSWAEVQALGTRAATGAGVPTAQALSFSGMLTRHLADGGAEKPISDALDQPESIVALALRVEEIVERASVTGHIISEKEDDLGQLTLLASWLHSLPCQAAVSVDASNLSAKLDLACASTRTRPDRVHVSDDLYCKMSDLAARTYVPDSAESRALGAGADMMELD